MELLGLFWFLWALLRVAGYPLRKTSSYQECFPLVSNLCHCRKMRLQIVSNWPFNPSYILKIIADVFPLPVLTHTLMLQTSKLIKPLLLKELTLTNYQLISESDDQHLAATWYKCWGHFFLCLCSHFLCLPTWLLHGPHHCDTESIGATSAPNNDEVITEELQYWADHNGFFRTQHFWWWLWRLCEIQNITVFMIIMQKREKSEV